MGLSIAYQLYSAREEAAQDLPGTLRKLKELGYQGVELAGQYGYQPEELRNMLAEIGLVPISAHVGLGEFSQDLDHVIQGYKTIGCEYLAIPCLDENQRPDSGNFDKVIEEMQPVAECCAQAGITLLYHNHDFEFYKMPDGTYGLDYLYAHVPAALLQSELDTCWIKFSGEDPAAYIKKYERRCPLVHVKDYTGSKEETGSFRFRAVGTGVQNFTEIVRAANESGSKWLIVEQDQKDGASALEDAQTSITNLKKIIEMER